MARKSYKYLQLAAYIILVFIMVITIGIAKDCSRLPSFTPEGYSRGDTIDIALIYGPGGYYTYDDTLGGINQEIAKAFERDTHTPIKIWPITHPEEGLEKLESGAFDILASLPLDNNIKKRFPLTESIFLDRLVLVQLYDSTGQKNVNSSLDLNGKTVAVVAGSTAIQRLKNLANEIGGKIEIIEEPDLSDELLTLQVANGTFPLAIVNERVAKELGEYYPDLNFDNSVSFTQFQVWLFNPADTMTYKKFNDWYEDFHNSDRYRRIIKTY